MTDIYNMTDAQVRAFENSLARHFGIRFIHDAKGLAERIAKWLLDRTIRRLSKNIVLDDLRPCTLKNLVFLSKGWHGYDQQSKIKTLIHETYHAMRIKKYPGQWTGWYREYFTRDNFRAQEEQAAQAVSSEVIYWATGVYPDVHMDGYMCSWGAVDSARIAYSSRRKQVMGIGRGATTERVSEFSIDALKKIGIQQHQ
jgi:hypothetical protein